MMSQLILWFIDLHFVHFAMWESSFFCLAHGGVTLANRYDYHPQNCVCETRSVASLCCWAQQFSFIVCAGPARNQNWCSYPETCWMVTRIFLIFLPNKFIFKQVQIRGLNYCVDTSSVSSVCNLTRRREKRREVSSLTIFGPCDNLSLKQYLSGPNTTQVGWLNNSVQQVLIGSRYCAKYAGGSSSACSQ